MELIDRYTTAIGKRLPPKNRADIESEIRSTLQDMLEDRSQKSGRPVDDAMISEVLKAYGAPDKVAATYLPERYLIGPRLYPFFMLVVKIVAAVLTALAVVGMGIGLGSAAPGLNEVVKIIGKDLLQYIHAIITALGNIVLIFAILERVLPESEIKSLKNDHHEWDPAELMKAPDADAFGLWEPIFAIVITFAGIIIFNFYPQIIGFTPSLNNLGKEPVVFIPLLSDAFFRYLPWLNVLWVLQIALNLFLLHLGRWNLVTRLASTGLKVFGIGITYAMLMGPSLVGITPEALANANITAGDLLVTLVTQAVRLALIIAIAAGSFDVIGDLYRLVVKGGRVKPVMVK
jgi:hypothetical protein